MEESSEVRRLVLGLGNPGPEYEGTRHNVGFAVVDEVARRERSIFGSPRSLEGWTGPRELQVARLPRLGALLAKPQAFMNRSGAVAAPLLRWAGCHASETMAVYDDIDLPFGALRIRPHGGAGGHNGVRSLIESLGTDRFPRLRVGIGRPGTDAARHVLARFSRSEAEEIGVSIAEAADAVLFWLESGDVELTMTRFHSRWTQGS